MAICKNCGCELTEGAKFCKECGSEVVTEEPVNVNETQFCSNCGFEMPKGIKFCPECGNPTTSAAQANNNERSVVNNEKSPFLAAILSFFIIGLGQAYLGLTKKGIILFISAFISGILMLLIIGWILWLLVWGYAIYDAYNSANKINQGIAVEDTLDLNNLF